MQSYQCVFYVNIIEDKILIKEHLANPYKTLSLLFIYFCLTRRCSYGKVWLFYFNFLPPFDIWLVPPHTSLFDGDPIYEGVVMWSVMPLGVYLCNMCSPRVILELSTLAKMQSQCVGRLLFLLWLGIGFKRGGEWLN